MLNSFCRSESMFIENKLLRRIDSNVLDSFLKTKSKTPESTLTLVNDEIVQASTLPSLTTETRETEVGILLIMSLKA